MRCYQLSLSADGGWNPVPILFKGFMRVLGTVIIIHKLFLL
jgi:hypothetical protein